MWSKNLGLLILVTLSSKIHLVKNRFQTELHSNTIFLPVVAKAIFGFVSGIKPIWWYPDLTTKEEKNLQLHNHASKSVIFDKW